MKRSPRDGWVLVELRDGRWHLVTSGDREQLRGVFATRPLAELDLALDALLARPMWSYLAPLKRLRPLWREMRHPKNRLRKPGGEARKNGSLVPNQHRMGPLTLDARRYALGVVLGIQREINDVAEATNRPRLDILNAEEVARILALIAANTWPNKWSGTEPRADAPFAEGYQGTLFDDVCNKEEAA